MFCDTKYWNHLCACVQHAKCNAQKRYAFAFLTVLLFGLNAEFHCKRSLCTLGPQTGYELNKFLHMAYKIIDPAQTEQFCDVASSRHRFECAVAVAVMLHARNDSRICIETTYAHINTNFNTHTHTPADDDGKSNDDFNSNDGDSETSTAHSTRRTVGGVAKARHSVCRWQYFNWNPFCGRVFECALDRVSWVRRRCRRRRWAPHALKECAWCAQSGSIRSAGGGEWRRESGRVWRRALKSENEIRPIKHRSRIRLSDDYMFSGTCTFRIFTIINKEVI